MKILTMFVAILACFPAKDNSNKVEENSGHSQFDSLSKIKELKSLYSSLYKQLVSLNSQNDQLLANLANSVGKVSDSDMQGYLQSGYLQAAISSIEAQAEAPEILRDHSVNAAAIVLVTVGSLGLAGALYKIRPLENIKISAVGVSLALILNGSLLLADPEQKNRQLQGFGQVTQGSVYLTMAISMVVLAHLNSIKAKNNLKEMDEIIRKFFPELKKPNDMRKAEFLTKSIEELQKLGLSELADMIKDMQNDIRINGQEYLEYYSISDTKELNEEQKNQLNKLFEKYVEKVESHTDLKDDEKIKLISENLPLNKMGIRIFQKAGDIQKQKQAQVSDKEKGIRWAHLVGGMFSVLGASAINSGGGKISEEGASQASLVLARTDLNETLQKINELLYSQYGLDSRI